MSSDRTECGLPSGSPPVNHSGPLRITCTGGQASERLALCADVAGDLGREYRVLLQRGNQLPPLEEADGGDPMLQVLEVTGDEIRWVRRGRRDHFSPLAEWDEAEIVFLVDGDPIRDGQELALHLEADTEGVRTQIWHAESGVLPVNSLRHALRETSARAPLFGLVLAGGHSRRMGRDKAELPFVGIPQWKRALETLSPHCTQTLLSRRSDQDCPADTPCITDRFLDFGPMGGMLSAMHAHPGAAWLVLACDLPFVDGAVLEHLIRNRRHTALATAYADPASGLPEPLCAIWEPRMKARLHRFMAEGVHCPRKALIRSHISLLALETRNALDNINRPEDYQRALERLKDTP